MYYNIANVERIIWYKKGEVTGAAIISTLYNFPTGAVIRLG
jgi:hypothetical protein